MSDDGWEGVFVLGASVRAWQRWAKDLHWLGPVLKQRCTNEGNWVLNRPRRWWLTLKAVTALLVGREGDCTGAYHDHVEVAMGKTQRTYSPEWGEGGEFDYLAVPYRGWRYEIGSDGWP